MLQIPVELAQAIADYLQGRPYKEVAGLIAALARMKPVEEDANCES